MSNLTIARLDTCTPDFADRLNAALVTDPGNVSSVQARVTEIIERVKKDRDQALLHYSRVLDGLSVESVSALEVPSFDWQQAFEQLSPAEREALETAAQRVRDYHSRQLQEPWQYEDCFGNLLGQQITPLDRVGIYVPGGKAAYPSSVLMNTIPAKVAGVGEIIMVVPATRGALNPMVLAAAHAVQVDRLFMLGGAHAVAALAYGTETVPAVSKIVGPGNAYVAEAKRQVFGKVGIDMIAGPSEVLVICDGGVSPDWVAMDLFSQAEHDEAAQAILICPDADFLTAVEKSMQAALVKQPRAQVITDAINNRGLLIKSNGLEQAIDLANQIAPEHLQLCFESAQAWLPKIKHAGSIFVGPYTPEAFGDYCAGPNHVLPASGSARFASPLGVYDFQKRSSVIQCTQSGAQPLSDIASTLADSEGLHAHAASARLRGGAST